MTTTAPTDLDTISHRSDVSQAGIAGGVEQTSRDQGSYETHRKAVAAPLDGSHFRLAAHSTNAAVTTLATGNQVRDATQAVGEAGSNPLDGGQRSLEAQSRDVAVEQAGTVPPAILSAGTKDVPRRGPFLYDPFLLVFSDSLDGIESLRIATENRYRQLTRTEVDKDGEQRGLGLNVLSPQVAQVATLLRHMKCDTEVLPKLEGRKTSGCCLEHDAVRVLAHQVKQSPLYSWAGQQKGVGAKQVARLLAAIGDPYWNDLHDRPRTVSELWAYCGYAVTDGRAQRRTKGQKANWNDNAKMRVYLVALSCMKSTGHYRKVYEAARLQYADAVHPHDCVRCGPAGHPAVAGSPLSAGHQMNRALRRVSKEILKDLWLEARQLHTGETPD